MSKSDKFGWTSLAAFVFAGVMSIVFAITGNWAWLVAAAVLSVAWVVLQLMARNGDDDQPEVRPLINSAGPSQPPKVIKRQMLSADARAAQRVAVLEYMARHYVEVLAEDPDNNGTKFDNAVIETLGVLKLMYENHKANERSVSDAATGVLT